MTKEWLKAAGIRAVKTFFQTFVATIVSLATSLAGIPEVESKPLGGDKK